MKSKLTAAVAKTTVHQSAETKKVIAKDAESFSKYLSTSKNADERDKSTVSTCKKQTNISSPSDIGKITIPTSNSKQKSKPAEQSPRVSPRMPANSYQFQKDWKSVKGDLDLLYDYLKVPKETIQYADMPSACANVRPV